MYQLQMVANARLASSEQEILALSSETITELGKLVLNKIGESSSLVEEPQLTVTGELYGCSEAVSGVFRPTERHRRSQSWMSSSALHDAVSVSDHRLLDLMADARQSYLVPP